MRALNKISDIVNFLAENTVAILMGIMTVVVFTQVIFRLTAGSIPWSEELARYTMIYMVYIGTSVGVKKNSHIAVEFVVGLLPVKARKAVEILADVMMLICFYVIVFYGLKIVKITMMQKSPALHVKMGYVYFSLVLGGFLMGLQCLINLIRCIAAFVTGDFTEDAQDSFLDEITGAKASDKVNTDNNADRNKAAEKKGGNE